MPCRRPWRPSGCFTRGETVRTGRITIGPPSGSSPSSRRSSRPTRESAGGVRAYLERKLKDKQKIMGLGHRVYKVKDPRATILQTLCERLFKECGASPLYEVALEVERVAVELLAEKEVHPNVDFYSGIIYDKLGIPVEFFTPIFAMARVAGWLAHWFEQLKENKLYRPDQIYAGEHNRPYVPIEKR